MARALPISLVVGRLHGKETATVQAVIFPRPEWSVPAARAWLRRNGFAASLEDTQRSLRASQHPAGEFRRGSLRTLHTAGHAAITVNPRSSRPRTLSVPEKDFRAAVALYRKFREAEPRRVAVRTFTVPRMLMQIGPVRAVEYFTTHKGREVLYRHHFAPQAMPTLAASANGRALYFVGGHYDFTRDGIVDR